MCQVHHISQQSAGTGSAVSLSVLQGPVPAHPAVQLKTAPSLMILPTALHNFKKSPSVIFLSLFSLALLVCSIITCTYQLNLQATMMNQIKEQKRGSLVPFFKRDIYIRPLQLLIALTWCQITSVLQVLLLQPAG